MNSQKVCIVVPCYNEESRLDQQAFTRFFEQHPDIHFLFVNDGSKDRTWQVIEKLKQSRPQVDGLNLQQNQGKALAVRAGCLHACSKDFTHVGYWDADLATPLDEIPTFMGIFNSKPQLYTIVGSRLKRLGAQIHRKLSRHLIGRIFATLASVILQLHVYDTQCGAKIFTRTLASHIFREAFVSYWIFDVELFFRIKSSVEFQHNPHGILELPLFSWIDQAGSKLKMTDFLKAPLELWHIFVQYRLKRTTTVSAI